MKINANWLNKEISIIEQRAAHQNAEEVVFGAGYGPSGIPHIGTLCEVLRVNTVRQAYEQAFNRRTQLVLIADDLDAFRKIPANLPNREQLALYLGKPICQVPSPDDNHEFLGDYVKDLLDKMLARYEIDYQAISSAHCYQTGVYDSSLNRFLQNYESINHIISSSVGPIRRQTYSIFMPVSSITGRVIEHLEVLNIDKKNGLLTYRIPANLVIAQPGADYSVSAEEYYDGDPIGEEITTSIYGGNCKLQWKADWAMRLIHRNVSYEMHGEDLTDSATVVRQIFDNLEVPHTRLYRYGLFIDEQGKKLSKSKGTGLSVAQAQEFLSNNALQLYLALRPNRSRVFSVSSIPFIADLGRYLKINDTDSHKPYRDLTDKMSEVDETSFPWSFKKTLGVFDACRPERLEYAAQYLSRYLDAPAKYWQSHDQVNRIWRFYSECLSQQTCATITLRQKNFLSALASSLNSTPAKEFNLFSINLRIKSVIESSSENISTAEAYEAMCCALIGRDRGPRITTWIEIHGIELFIQKIEKSLDHLNNQTNKTVSTPELVTAPHTETKSMQQSVNPMWNPSSNKKSFERIDFLLVERQCKAFAEHLTTQTEALAEALEDFECHNVVVDEIERSVELLENIIYNREFFKGKIHGVTTFLPLNQPLYATTCFALVPSLMAHHVNLRPPTAMQEHYRKLETILNLPTFFPNVSVSYEDKEEFVSRVAPITDAVIFTGTPENGNKVRKKFLKRTLFILNGSGHNPLVISHDADLSKAVESVLRVVLYNQGQDCAGPNAILVHREVYQQVKDLLIAELNRVEHQVGMSQNRNNIVGPNSDPNHTVSLATIFKEYRPYCIYGGDINPISGLIKPTVFSKQLKSGGNYKEFFAPVVFLQPYEQDSELAEYFENSQYHANAMYAALFGSSDYIEKLIEKGVHSHENVLRNTDLHIVEKGYLPYGGFGPAASCLYANGVQIKGATLPQRDIFQYLVKPYIS